MARAPDCASLHPGYEIDKNAKTTPCTVAKAFAAKQFFSAYADFTKLPLTRRAKHWQNGIIAPPGTNHIAPPCD